MKENEMNLYILNNVLSDYYDGMAVIAAPSLERCRELFLEEFGKYQGEEFDQFAKIKVIENVSHVEGVVSYVYGGG
jgi:hypothetical protein